MSAKPNPAPIEIADYDPGWPVQFKIIKSRISVALGPLAVAIEHVGSTSVPGLAAKPIIDLDIAVPEDADIPVGIRLLATIGYEHEGDLGITGREAFTTRTGLYRHHPYLVTVNGRELQRHIAFRNRLRTDISARNEYELLKRRLAIEFAADVTNYSKAKTEFVERILAEELGVGH